MTRPEFETNGCKSFVVDSSKIDLHEEIAKGAKILTFSTETRDSLINDTISPNWINNLKVGDTTVHLNPIDSQLVGNLFFDTFVICVYKQFIYRSFIE
jgi:hypothetical protein